MGPTFFFVVLGILKVSCSCLVGESSPPPAAVAAEGAGMEGAGGGGVEAVVASLSAFLLFALLLATDAPSETFSAAALPSAAPWAGSSLSLSKLWLRLAFLEEVFDLLPFLVLVPLSEGAGAGGGGGGGRLSIQQGMR